MWQASVESFPGCVASDSFCQLPNTMAAFFLLVYAKKKRKKRKNAIFSTRTSQIWCMWNQREENQVLSAARERALQMVWFYLQAVYWVKILNLFHTFRRDYSIVVCVRRPLTWLLAWVFQMWCLSFFLLDRTGFKTPSGWNMNLESHTFKMENGSWHFLV